MSDFEGTASTPARSACALLSVSDKQGIEDLARALSAKGLTLLSTGGTASLLRDAGLEVTDVSTHTGAAEMMAGRVKTLHPKVHGGILGRRGLDDDVMVERDIAPIDFVIVNLYPFAATVARADATFDEAIENIDIGGPAMIRSAAKNHASVAVITDPADYSRVIETLDASDEEQAALRFDLATKAFEHTAAYDGMIAEYLGRRTDPTVTEGFVGAAAVAPAVSPVDASANETAKEAANVNVPTEVPAVFPRTLNRQFHLVETLRYGENPHQRAAFYRDPDAAAGTLATASFCQGKSLSYNNMMDADAALACVRQFSETACVIVKHGNPCGVAVAESVQAAYDAAYKTDPTSAFGGIIAFNRSLDKATVAGMLARQFVEVVIAPGIDAEALALFAEKPNVRVLDCGTAIESDGEQWQFRPVSGGLLVQDDDLANVGRDQLKLVSKRKPTDAELDDLLFTWKVAKFVKSNAIVYGRALSTIGVGAGQMSRVYSARIAGIKAQDEGLEVKGSVMASDAFFPFRDGIDNAAKVGITAVIQPGGSRNDEEVIAAADEHGMAMVFSGVRHFRH